VDVTSGGAALTTCWMPSYRPEKNILPQEWGTPSTSSILYDEQTETLLYIDSLHSVDFNTGDLGFNVSLFSRHPRCKLLSGYQDSHVYVCQRNILDILVDKTQLLSFREEFLPWLCKMQYQSMKKHGQGPQAPSTKLALEHSTNRGRASLFRSTVYTTRPHVQSNAAFIPIKSQTNIEPPSPRISIMLLAIGALRINSISTFFEINRRLLSSASFTLPLDPKERSLIDPKAQISADSIVGNSTQVSERVVIKRSAIGRHCKIGKQAKVSNCILFDHCVVGDGARLDNCILGRNTKIGMMAEIVRCVTQAGYEVMPEESIKNEKLEVSDWTLSAGFNTDGEIA